VIKYLAHSACYVSKTTGE